MLIFHLKTLNNQPVSGVVDSRPLGAAQEVCNMQVRSKSQIMQTSTIMATALLMLASIIGAGIAQAQTEPIDEILDSATEVVCGIEGADEHVCIAAGEVDWMTRYDGPESRTDRAEAIAVNPDGTGIYVTGYSLGPGTGRDFATVAYAPDGTEQWVARHDGQASGSDQAKSVAVSPDGDKVFVTGNSPGIGTGSDIVTIAYDAQTGAELWTARYDAGSHEVVYAMAVNPTGSHVYVTGYTGDILFTGTEVATVAYDTDTGDQSWAHHYKGPTTAYSWDSGYDLAVSPDGSQLFVGGTAGSDPDGGFVANMNYVTLAYDTDAGSVNWIAAYDGPKSDTDEIEAVAISPDGTQVFVTGFSSDSNNAAVTIAYSTADGTELWKNERVDDDGSRHAWDMVVAPDGQSAYIVVIAPDSFSYGIELVALDSDDGSVSWEDRYTSDGSVLPSEIAISPDGSMVAVTGAEVGDDGNMIATISYDASEGSQLWRGTHDGPGSDKGVGLRFSPDGDQVYVAGQSPGDGTGVDYLTIAYNAVPELGPSLPLPV